jgi:hypothetical protein
MLTLPALDGRFFLANLDSDWLSPLPKGGIGMDRDILLAGVLRRSLLQLIDLFQAEAGLFL